MALDHFLDHRAELAAGAAPGRPEIDDHGLGVRRLDHIGHELLVGGVFGVQGCGIGHG
jgi:hypothetical protein